MSEPFMAEIRIFAGNFAPRGWAFCNGQTVLVSQNPALFSLLGTVFGGNGRTNFGLPNLQGRAPMHPGRGPGLTARTLGQIIGNTTATLVESQVPSHSHTMNSLPLQGDQGVPTNAVPARTDPGSPPYGSAQNLTAMAAQAVSSEGGGQEHENMQPFLAINFIIALVGTFPSRG